MIEFIQILLDMNILTKFGVTGLYLQMIDFV